MSAEDIAATMIEVLDEETAWALGPTVDEDLRSGGFFFDLTWKGRTYEVLVVETR